MNLTRCACSPRSMIRLRACWAVQSPVGCRVTPRLLQLGQQIESGIIDKAALQKIEDQDNIFAGMATAAAFASEGKVTRQEVAATPPAPVPADTPLQIVMVCPELVPFAKTGGLV